MKCLFYTLLLAFAVFLVGSCGSTAVRAPEVNNVTDIKVNGDPYFPIAIYAWCPDIISDSADSELDILESAGFNLIDVKLKDTTQNKYLEFMDKCKARGISVILEGNTEAATRGSNDPRFSNQ